MPTPIIYPPTINGLQKTLDAELLTGVTASATLNNVTGIQNLKGLMVIDRVDGNNNLTPNKREYISFAGTSGSTVTTLVRGLAGSTDQDHAVGAIVEFVSDVVQQQAIIDGLLNVNTIAGVLDTTKVVDLTTAQTLTNKRLTSPKINEDVALTATATQLNTQVLSTADNWTNANESWAYATASTITVPSGAASKYRAGDILKWTQTTVKYGVITSVADTVLTIAVNTDYVVADAAITENYYSHGNAIGFPKSFNWTPTYDGLTEGAGTNAGLYTYNNGVFWFKVKFIMAGDSSVTGAPIRLSNFPVAMNSIYANLAQVGYGTAFDATGSSYSILMDRSGNIFTDYTGGAYANSSSSSPFTWTTSDSFEVQGFYFVA